MSRRIGWMATAGLLAGLTSAVVPAGTEPASAAPDQCFTDAGAAVTFDGAPGEHRLDRFTFDHEGRIITISKRIARDEYVEDVVRRFHLDGTLDTSFGGPGGVVLPPAYATNARNVAVDSQNRVWVGRADYLNTFQLLRITADGVIDPAVPARSTSPTSSTIGPVGSLIVTFEDEPEAYVGVNTFAADGGQDRGGILRVRVRQNEYLSSSQGQHEPTHAVVIDHALYGAIIDRYRPGGSIRGSRIESLSGIIHDGFAERFTAFGAVLSGVTERPLVLGTTPFGQTFARMLDSSAANPSVQFDLGDDGLLDVPVAATDTGEFVAVDANGRVWWARAGYEERNPLDSSVLELTSVVEIGGPGAAIDAYPAEIFGHTNGRQTIALFRAPQGEAVITLITTGLTAPLRPENGALSSQVRRLYFAFHMREPSPDELAQARLARARGQTADELADTLYDSDEFFIRHGLMDDDAYVDLAYRNALGQRADEHARYFYGQRLASGELTRGGLMLELAESEDRLDREPADRIRPHSAEAGQVHRLYRAYFDRDADEQGFCHWVRRLGRNASLATISEAFARSAEFELTYGDVTDTEFVDLVYANVLKRTPDAAGRSYWLGELAAGRTDRGTMLIWFSESAEYILATDSLP